MDTKYVIAVENNGEIDEQIVMTAEEDYNGIYENLWRLGYKDDIYRLYREEAGERSLMGTYSYNEKA